MYFCPSYDLVRQSIKAIMLGDLRQLSFFSIGRKIELRKYLYRGHEQESIEGENLLEKNRMKALSEVHAITNTYLGTGTFKGTPIIAIA